MDGYLVCFLCVSRIIVPIVVVFGLYYFLIKRYNKLNKYFESEHLDFITQLKKEEE